ncbi:Transcription factor MYB3 [Frankliniella fusca]|uniref:Transcription factor MYB3 n=1 Tax=Frankliniella fusca TaxID=407009 RepID=A0AAE1HPL9_9NEOP|nr:Transcription factor MYB3 [Frankliniella fusca]
MPTRTTGTAYSQVCPPSVSKNGDLRLPENKSEILSLLVEGRAEPAAAPESRDCLIVDASILPHLFPPRTSNTFIDYWQKDLKPKLVRESVDLQKQRLDLAWDLYSPSSLKRTTREKRGHGVKKQVLPNTLMPKNWKSFLQNDDNKSSLYSMLANQSLSMSPDLLVVTNVGKTFRSSKTAGTQLSGLPCLLEEADARLIVHAADAARNGCEHIVIRSVDSDVVVLAVSYFFQLCDLGVKYLWVDFGVGKSRRYFAVHEIAARLGQHMSTAIRGFHAFTGCDTTSTFYLKGKKSAWKTWKTFPEVTEAFEEISLPYWAVSEKSIRLLSGFIVRLYGGPLHMDSVNKARLFLFRECKKSLLDGLPPTAGVLLQHILRATYQAGHMWGQSMIASPELPSPADWGWRITPTGAGLSSFHPPTTHSVQFNSIVCIA